MTALAVLAAMDAGANALFDGSESGRQSGVAMNDARAAVGELIAAANAYFSGYCQDEASEDGPEFTGCTQEQHEAAKRLQAALAGVLR